MKRLKSATMFSDNMSFFDRGIRIGLGLTVLLGAMQVSMNGGDAYPIIKLFAATIVLTGIAGWDPFYEMSRNIMSRMTNMEIMTFSAGNISMPDRALRIGLGFTVLIASLQAPIGGSEAYAFIKLFATTVVLTGIAGWDPLYAAFRNIVSRFRSAKIHRQSEQYQHC